VETFIYFAVATAASRLIPLAIGLRRWRTLTLAALLLMAFISLSLVGDVTMYVLGRVLKRNNLWVSHLLIGIQTPVLLLAFSEWLPARSARTLRLGALAAFGAWLILTLAVETPGRFARVTGPLQSAIFCLYAVSVLITRGLSAEGRMMRSDWFWVSSAVLLVYGLTAVHRPLLDLFTAGGVEAIPGWTVLKALGVLQIIANVMFARGLSLPSTAVHRQIPVLA
jgi:hypothetical protein